MSDQERPNDKKSITPPMWAEKLLALYCRPDLLEDLQGDLNEYFDRNVKAKGIRKARLIFIVDVFKFFRLYTIRKPEFVNLLINWIMLGSYIKTSARSISRNKLFSAINIFGLAISMSIGLLTISMLTDVFSYDKFNSRHTDIYRIKSDYENVHSHDQGVMATTSMKAARLIQENFSAPEAVAIFHFGFAGDFKTNEKVIPLKGFWANESVFKVFDFELIKGNRSTALKEPFSIVITESASKKLFGEEDAIGKIIVKNDREFKVTGILKELPRFSHIRFEALGSLVTEENRAKENNEQNSWTSIWGTWVYVLMPVKANTDLLDSNLARLSAAENKEAKNMHVELKAQPLDNIMIGEEVSNNIGPMTAGSAPWIFGGLSFIVLLSACFNYANLSIARSLKRTREVGIRKVIGALKTHVIGQFVIEATIIAIGALSIALGLFIMIRPYFLAMSPTLSDALSLQLSPMLIVCFIGFALFTGILSGLFPALFFSRVNAISVLKGSTPSGHFKKFTLRKALIVFQYSLSIIFISSTILIYKQYKHFISYDLGFKTANILNIRLQGNGSERLKNGLRDLPEVTAVSQSLLVSTVGGLWFTKMKYHANPNDSVSVFYNTIDENYLPLHQYTFLAGRNFIPKSDSAKESEVIVTENVLKRFNIANQDPVRATDEIVKINGMDLRIIGVLKEFQYAKASVESNNLVIFRYSSHKANHLNVKIESSDLLATREKIEAIWNKIDPAHPLDAKFYDEQLEESFTELSSIAKIAGVLAFLTLCISSLGLLGMVVFTTETRLKEIGLRKVLGATESGLIYLLGKGFFILLIIATIISLPVTIILFEKLLFPSLSNEAPISFFDLIKGVAAILLVALVMIGLQTLKAARTNPSEVLKND